MELRKRNAAKNICAEDTSEDSDSSRSECASSDDDLYYPTQKSKPKADRRVGNTRNRASVRVRKPELLEVAFQYLEFRQHCDITVLKALRLTSKRMREIVENDGALTHFSFRGRGQEAFDQYLASPTSIQRVQSMYVCGKLTIQQGIKFILQPPPRLKSLELVRTSDATEAILLGTFPHLTSFTLKEWPSKIDAGKSLAEVAWPLQELEIKHLASSSETLAAILVNFPDLRKLKLPYVGLQDASFVHPYEGILQKLEELEIKTSSSTSERFLELVLFHENLQLPSLHTLDYHLCYTNNI